MTINRTALFLALCALTLAPLAIAGTITYSNVENITSGWGSCASTSCAGGGGSGSYSFTTTSSPSLDGKSMRYSISPSSSFYNVLWWRHLTTNSSISHFKMDMYQYMNVPSDSQAIEYATNQYMNGWYKFSTQCSFNKGVWQVWDSYNQHWAATSIPCRRPAANTWQHITFEWARANGKAVFVAITLNGQKYYINRSFSPQKKTGSYGSIGMHYQLDGNSSKTKYAVWVDKLAVTLW